MSEFSLTEKKIQNGRRLLSFQISPTYCGKHLMRFQSETFVFKFLLCSVDEKHLMRFQTKTYVFKSLLCSVDGKHLMRFQSRSFILKFLRLSVDGFLLFTVIYVFYRYQFRLLNGYKRKEGSLGREPHRRKAKRKARNLRRLVLQQLGWFLSNALPIPIAHDFASLARATERACTLRKRFPWN